MCQNNYELPLPFYDFTPLKILHFIISFGEKVSRGLCHNVKFAYLY